MEQHSPCALIARQRDHFRRAGRDIHKNEAAHAASGKVGEHDFLAVIAGIDQRDERQKVEVPGWFRQPDDFVGFCVSRGLHV